MMVVLVLSKNQRIHIIHTNDLHSSFENMPKISTYIKKVKNDLINTDERVIVVDLGDHMDRMQIETEGTSGKVNVEVLNQTGVDVITIGNNEGLTFTKELLANAYKNKKFRIVACNIKDSKTKQPPSWIDEYWIQEVGDLKIGWVGATAPYETFYGLQGWDVEKPFNCIKEVVRKIKSQVDVVILLSHLGIRDDKCLAESIPEIDVILGGHTHRFFENGIKEENQPLICQVGIFGDYIGHLTIDYKLDKRSISNMKERTVPVIDFEDDSNILHVIYEYRKIAKIELSTTIAMLKKPLSISIESESQLGNLLADGVKKWVNAELALINTGQVLGGLKHGEVTKERIHQICPSPINACRLKLTGAQIKTTLEQSLLDEYIHKSFKGFGFRGEVLGTLNVSGIQIEYNMSAPPYKKIVRIKINDAILDNEEEYIVGTLDMFTFGGGYSVIKDGKDIEYFLPEFIRDILAIQLNNEESIKESLNHRWIKN